jgi:CDP-glycerol glycerophosphotransferase (TagB/SpsB family)
MALFYRRNKTHGIHVFLQHGITKNFIEGFLYKNCKSLKLFVCGAKPEYDYLLNNFGYDSGIVKYTGFARYDQLTEFIPENRILFMPTWRRYLDGISKEDFLNSLFYKKWSELCNSKELIDVLRNNNLKLDFYLHSSLQKYSDCFVPNNILNVIFFKDRDVQSLLKEDRILVTDFSSVFFDFAYMRKPMVFYQFDEKEYYQGHYDKGYFDYRDDGFGDVCVSKDSAIKSIVNVISNECKIEEKYFSRIDKYFTFKDKNNCERIFKTICSLIN